MKLIKVAGASILVLSGYLMLYFSDARLSEIGMVWLGLLVFILVVIGLTAIFANDTKSFKNHVKDILNGLPI